MLQGTIQQAGNSVRLTMRVVNVSTLVIVKAGMGDTVGGGIPAVFDAARHALAKIGPFSEIKDRRLGNPSPSGGVGVPSLTNR